MKWIFPFLIGAICGVSCALLLRNQLTGLWHTPIPSEINHQLALKELQSKYSNAKQHVAELEEENTMMLEALQSTAMRIPRSVASPALTKISAEQVNARYRHGKQLAREGQYQEALTEFLWCYDEGMRLVPSLEGIRGSFLLGDISRLAKSYSPARDALTARRSDAEREMITGPQALTATRDFAALNTALGEEAATLSYFDRLPTDDPRRSLLNGLPIYGQLVENKRYAEATDAMPYAKVDRLLDLATRPSFSAKLSPERQIEHRQEVITMTVRNFEVLVGAGNLDAAKSFAAKLLRYDQSSATLLQLQRAAARAGRPTLVVSPNP